jgi:hypothetical protein
MLITQFKHKLKCTFNVVYIFEIHLGTVDSQINVTLRDRISGEVNNLFINVTREMLTFYP